MAVPEDARNKLVGSGAPLAQMTPDGRSRQATEPLWAQSCSSESATEQNVPYVRCVHELVSEQATRTPHGTAIVCDESSLSYSDLEQEANLLAQKLRAVGVGVDAIVGIFVERSIEMVIGFLAAMKAGGAYLPLDPQLPDDRLRFILADAGATTVVAHTSAQARLRELTDLPIVDFSGQEQNRGSASFVGSRNSPTIENLAYLIYTSGSTGRPKGVLVPHRGLCNLIAWHSREFELTVGTRTAQIASMMFDAAAWEIWPSLAVGAVLVMCRQSSLLSPHELSSWLAKERINVAFVPTPIAEQLLANPNSKLEDLRYLLTGGDALRQVPCGSVRYRVINNYGPTEASVVATSGEVTPDSPLPPPIGRPIRNTRAYVLDDRLQAVSTGVEGELYLAGEAVARGYLTRLRLRPTSCMVPVPMHSPGFSRVALVRSV